MPLQHLEEMMGSMRMFSATPFSERLLYEHLAIHNQTYVVKCIEQIALLYIL